MKKSYDLTDGNKGLFASEDEERQAWSIVDGGGVLPEDSMKPRRPKDNLVISSFDRERLVRLLNSGGVESVSSDDIADLVHEIERGVEVKPQEMPPDVVTMNSTVRVTDLDAGSTHVYTIVFPADADYEKGRISILAPLGTALLGYRVGDTVNWPMPRGVRRFRIDEILYQPEAAGDFHL